MPRHLIGERVSSLVSVIHTLVRLSSPGLGLELSGPCTSKSLCCLLIFIWFKSLSGSSIWIWPMVIVIIYIHDVSLTYQVFHAWDLLHSPVQLYELGITLPMVQMGKFKGKLAQRPCLAKNGIKFFNLGLILLYRTSLGLTGIILKNCLDRRPIFHIAKIFLF